jgi:hypothetical protein
VAAALAALAAEEGWPSREVLDLLVIDLDPAATIHAQLSRCFMEQTVHLAIERHNMEPADLGKECGHGALGDGEVAVASDGCGHGAKVTALRAKRQR